MPLVTFLKTIAVGATVKEILVKDDSRVGYSIVNRCSWGGDVTLSKNKDMVSACADLASAIVLKPQESIIFSKVDGDETTNAFFAIALASLNIEVIESLER